MDQTIEHLVAAAHAGGEVLRQRFGNHGQVNRKSTAADVQTEADLQAERAILARLERALPDCNIIAEESGRRDRGSSRTIVLDPLDGTNNFVLGIPHFAVSIALLEGGRIHAAVVHQPILRQTYWASRGGGAFRDGQPIRVNRQSDMALSTFSQVYPYRVEREDVIERASRIWRLGGRRLLTVWSPALDFCLLASGKVEAVVHSGSEFYDYAAGKLIAREAGAKISALDGSPETSDRNTRFLASNGTAIHQRLIACLKFTSDVVTG